jgi:hypothetical protein
LALFCKGGPKGEWLQKNFYCPAYTERHGELLFAMLESVF